MESKRFGGRRLRADQYALNTIGSRVRQAGGTPLWWRPARSRARTGVGIGAAIRSSRLGEIERVVGIPRSSRGREPARNVAGGAYDDIGGAARDTEETVEQVADVRVQA